MNLKESLIQLCDMQKEVKELQKKIEKLKKQPKEKQGSVEASSQYMPFQKYISNVFGYKPSIAKQINEYYKLLEKRVENLLKQIIIVDCFIENIQDSRMRRIIEFRYIDQYSWVKVASLIDNYATEDSIRKEHDRFLDKN